MSNLLQAHRERVGRRVKAARSDANLTLDGLAARVGTTRQHLIKLEKGQHAPRAEMIQKIAEATGKAPSFFSSDEDEEEAQAMHNLSLSDALHEIAVAQKELANVLSDMRMERVA